MLRKYFRQSAGDIGANHRGSIHPSDARSVAHNGDRLHTAIAAVEKVQIHRRLGDRLGKVAFHSQPLFLPHPIFCRWTIQIRPPSRSIHQRTPFKLSTAGYNTKRTGAGDALHCDLLPRIHSATHGRVPESHIEIHPSNAGCRWIHLGAQRPAIKKNPGTRNSNRIVQQTRVPVVEQVLQQSQRLRRDKLAAHFMPRKSTSLQQQHETPRNGQPR